MKLVSLYLKKSMSIKELEELIKAAESAYAEGNLVYIFDPPREEPHPNAGADRSYRQNLPKLRFVGTQEQGFHPRNDPGALVDLRKALLPLANET